MLIMYILSLFWGFFYGEKNPPNIISHKQDRKKENKTHHEEYKMNS